MTISGHGHPGPSHYSERSQERFTNQGGTQLGLEQFQLTVETPDCALGDACITSRGARCGKQLSCHDHRARR